MNILVVVAHPDDEVLGMGATIAKHIQNGDQVTVVFMTDGVSSRFDQHKKTTAAHHDQPTPEETLRAEEMFRAMAILGVSKNHIHHFQFPDQGMDVVPLLEITKKIETVKSSISPSRVYTHFWGDLNLDHRIVYNAVTTAFRPINGQRHEEIFCFEIPETTGLWIPRAPYLFQPDTYEDISEFLDHKLKAIQVYESEERPYPHPRSPKAIQEWSYARGRETQATAAEAFVKCWT